MYLGQFVLFPYVLSWSHFTLPTGVIVSIYDGERFENTWSAISDATLQLFDFIVWNALKSICYIRVQLVTLNF